MLIVDRPTGRIIASVSGNFSPPVEENLCVVEGNVDDPSAYYYDIQNGKIIQKAPQPSVQHEFEWASKSWVFPPQKLQILRRDVASRISVEFSARDQAPCGAFDADDTARANINGVMEGIRQDGALPQGWIGWRAADNSMHHVESSAAEVADFLVELSRAIRNRKQALYVASWQKKASLGALSADSLLSYDTEAGWPT